jgi:hypothetical protein
MAAAVGYGSFHVVGSVHGSLIGAPAGTHTKERKGLPCPAFVADSFRGYC